MPGGFDSMSRKKAVRLVLCSGPDMGDTLLKCQMTTHSAERAFVLRCMKTACNKRSSE